MNIIVQVGSVGGLGKRHVGISGLVAATVDISTHTISTYLQHIYNLSIFIYTQVGATAYPGVGLGVPGMAQHIATTTQHQRYGYLTASKHFY